ncbi:DNA-binding transcriptional regulator, MocR family, contains an aminotransferase domain [Oceanospirillum multiglobuliferum]|uniref:HTH gntR-type domain-containing protein n=1 Tax=Oceanospirillum multiglobuliferum TaxID=64969 RepID=A0A1T4SI31_9GAMM|nr:PLP-dependent aminotransferase family protein [Oceanospirillum multiglobuliferum]OPX54234.1 hypothetical protein BTE48_15320 [Oceanospirillum multiglobuliferum]SKA27608.1 DNA-binding transcriptional regulator, MocR family, contains an aminotransferase domain [Oceanospirillum multiglobuliferum]
MTNKAEKSNNSHNLYYQISQQIKCDLIEKAYQANQRLPSLRQISHDYQISLSTAQYAYQQLIDEGMVQVKPRAGYFLRPQDHHHDLQPQIPAPLPGAERVNVSELVVNMLSLARKQSVINLGTAVPEPALLPLTELGRVQRQISRKSHWAYGGYSPSGGEPVLQRALADYLKQKSVYCQPEQLLITNGCTEALRLALIQTTKAGDIVAVESPTYFSILQLLETLGLKALEIPTSPQTGIDLKYLANMMSAIRINACVVNPVGQNPLGFIMQDEHKKALIELCHTHGTPLIEDVINIDLVYQNNGIKPLRALDPYGIVSQCGSFSKTLSPALRVGWLLSAGQNEPPALTKFLTNVSVSTPCQLSVAQMLSNGQYQRAAKKNAAIHAHRVQQVREWILQRFPQGTRVSIPEAGFVLWIELPTPYSAMPLHRKALEKGVMFLPGNVFSPTSDLYNRYLRINCCACPPEQVDEGIRRISQCF